MDSIYVFRYTPVAIKRLIYLYLIGLGTPSSKLIKDEYEKKYQKYQDKIIENPYMSNMINISKRDIGFIGCKMCGKPALKRSMLCGLYKKYNSNINGQKIVDDLLLPQQNYEIDGAKLFYLYTYGDTHKFDIIMKLRSDNHSLEKLFKYKILQLKREEEEQEQELN